MELFQLYSGGMTNVNSADIWRMQYSTYFALENMIARLCYSSTNQQFAVVAGTPTASIVAGQWRIQLKKGYYMIDQKLSLLKQDMVTDLQDFTSTGYIYEYMTNGTLAQQPDNDYSDYFLTLTLADNYDPLGDKTFADGNVRQTWLKREFTVSITGTKPSQYLMRIRIKNDGTDCSIVEYPKDLNSAFAYRYGVPISETDLMSPLSDFKARTKLMSQHTGYLMNGGYLQGVAIIPTTEFTITNDPKYIFSGVMNNFTATISAQDLLDNSVIYNESSNFRPNITTNDIVSLIVDKIDFCSHNGLNMTKSWTTLNMKETIDYNLAGRPSQLSINYQDLLFPKDDWLKVAYSPTVFPNTQQPTNPESNEPWKAFGYRYESGTISMSNVLLDDVKEKAPVAGTDFDSFQITYRFRYNKSSIL